jgi:hypothetical protein
MACKMDKSGGGKGSEAHEDLNILAGDKEDEAPCGSCGKMVTNRDKGVWCEVCEKWYHGNCEEVTPEVYRLLKKEAQGVHWYCKGCERGVSKLLKVVSGLQVRVKQMDERMVKVEEVLNQTGGKRLVKHEEFAAMYVSETQRIGKDVKREMDATFNKIRDELIEVVSKRIGNELKADMDTAFRRVKDELTIVTDGLTAERIDGRSEEAVFTQLQKDMGDMRTQLENNVKHVKDDVEEKLEIERRKLNIVIHGVPECDAEKDIESVEEIIGEGLHMTFDRHIDSMMRMGRVTEGRPRPLRIVLKSFDSKKEILSRAKSLKEIDKFKRMFISPDLTRKQQDVDKQLRTELKRLREQGEVTAKIKYGKIVKNGRGGREEVLYQLAQHI